MKKTEEEEKKRLKLLKEVIIIIVWICAMLFIFILYDIPELLGIGIMMIICVVSVILFFHLQHIKINKESIVHKSQTPQLSSLNMDDQGWNKLLKEGKKLEQVYHNAKEGDADAQYTFGEKFYHGNVVSRDLAISIEWLEKSAHQGHINAQNLLGMIYHDRTRDGEGKGDYNKAFEWFLKAAEQGHSHSQYCLGEVYYYGLGVPKDIHKAKEWATKAEAQRHPDAEHLLKEINFELNN